MAKISCRQNIWWNTKTDDKKNKTNIGNPAAYSALRMLTDIVNHSLSGMEDAFKVTTTLRVVLVGCSEGVKPSTPTEMSKGIGTNAKRILDARLKADNHRIIKQSLDLFLKYVNAMTEAN